MASAIKKKKRMSPFRIIFLGFIGVIILGALLLMLPISSKSGGFTPFNQALFTSTSAVCVTGLVVQDTATYWSAFGQIVILALIQIGGLGVITMAMSFVMLSGKRLSLSQRSTMQNAISAPHLGGIVRLTKYVIRGTIAVELIGATILMPIFKTFVSPVKRPYLNACALSCNRPLYQGKCHKNSTYKLDTVHKTCVRPGLARFGTGNVGE